MSAPASVQEQAKVEEPKLSPAELKKRAKAEKQARRAAQKEQQPDAQVNGVNGEPKDTKPESGLPQQQQKPKVEKQQKPQQQKPAKQGSQDTQSHHKRTSSQSQQMPIRSQPPRSDEPNSAPKKENKQVQLFSHLYTQPRRHTIEGVSKDVHPAVLALGFQMSSYEICGSSARCVAMLLAFKEAISEYTTPSGTSLARHMTSHYLSPQIDFLKSCRPISESMGNAIRWLKKLVVEIDPSTPEQEAKDDLCQKIEIFIRERITITDQAIAESASHQIKTGSVVLTYAKSSIVEKTILEAHAAKKQFRVVVVDSRPLFEGKKLATSLMNAGLEVEYLPFSAISHAVKQASVVLLGAHSMLSNGRLQSRVGTASLAMQASKLDIPVIVCCESVKFSGRVALDSIVLNEVALAEELLLPTSTTPGTPAAKEGDEEEKEGKLKQLSDWRDIPNLQLLNLMYDTTPAEYIRMVICEYGSLPPSSVPVVHRIANEGI
jgi:translation initiation factor eIF-2B subunit delta